MKFRKGFVTNSSSSSFVIAMKDNQASFFKCFCNALILTTGNDTSEGTAIKTKEELDSVYEQELYGCMNTLEKLFSLYPEEKKMYERQCKLLEEGYIIVSKSIDYSDSALAELMYKMQKELGGEFIILNDD